MCRLLRRFFITFRIKALFFASLIFVLQLGHSFQYFLGTTPAVAQVKNPTQLLQNGVESYQEGRYSEAISFWEEALKPEPSEPVTEPTDIASQALIFENLARANLQIGQPHNSLEYWQKATDAYRQLENNTQVGRMLTEQAQTLINLSQHKRAIAILCAPQFESQESDSLSNCTANSSLAISKAVKDLEGQAAAHGSLAEAYRLQGRFQNAQTHADEVLELNLDQFEPQILNVQGKIHVNLAQVAHRRAVASESLNLEDTKFRDIEQEEINNAIHKFKESIEIQTDLESALAANLNLLNISTLQKDNISKRSIKTIQEDLEQLIREQLPDSHQRAYAAISLANSYQKPSKDYACEAYQANALNLLELARDIAIRIDDGRAQSFALGQLGHLYECQEDWETATTLTKQAQRSAGTDLKFADSLYLWEWQMGRIRQKQWKENRGEKALRDEALGFYEQAVTTLDKVRSDIITADRDLQFDFRDSSVEPLYRQYIGLQLDLFPLENKTKSTVIPIRNNPQQNTTLKNSLKTLDSLRLAELQNFFGDDCILESSDEIGKKLLSNDSKTVVISSIDFPDQTALIASFPNGDSILTRIPYEMEVMGTGQNLSETIDDYIQKLNEFWKLVTFNTQSAKALYDKLFGPFQDELKNQKIDTLVLVHDHLLRRVPMASLYTGKEYLAEKYAIATTPSLSLTIETAPRSASPKILVMGLTEKTKIGTQSYGGLPHVDKEIKSIQGLFKKRTTILKDNGFTTEKFKKEINTNKFSIIHFATHGQFSPSPEDSFLVTGVDDLENPKKFDDKKNKLTFDDLEDQLRESNQAEPIDLITLSACQTASGDNRSTLGLAGIAIRSGARSALASISVLEDNSASQMIEDFYNKYLQDTKLSKAQVLQEVQKNAITGHEGKVAPVHPGIWSQLVLVGNWQ